MELLKNLFEGYPNLWGGGVAHSVLILSLVIAFGIMLGKIKISGISLGVTWILFVGIVFGHFNLNLNEHLLHFLKEFGLILFVYSIGLQVGPGFFSAFKKGGFTLNMLAMARTSMNLFSKRHEQRRDSNPIPRTWYMDGDEHVRGLCGCRWIQPGRYLYTRHSPS